MPGGLDQQGDGSELRPQPVLIRAVHGIDAALRRETAAIGLGWAGRGNVARGGNPIGRQADRAQWRLFVRYLPGSYDPRDGLEHGWKTTPKLTVFGTEFLGPGRVLRRIDR